MRMIAIMVVLCAGVAHGAGPGTELTKMLQKRGFTTCGRCAATAARMDAMGSRGARRQRAALTREVVSNARAQGRRVGPLRRAGVRLALGVANRRARRSGH